MRTKNFLIILSCVVTISLLLILLGPTGQQNDSIKNIVSQNLRDFQVGFRNNDNN